MALLVTIGNILLTLGLVIFVGFLWAVCVKQFTFTEAGAQPALPCGILMWIGIAIVAAFFGKAREVSLLSLIIIPITTQLFVLLFFVYKGFTIIIERIEIHHNAKHFNIARPAGELVVYHGFDYTVDRIPVLLLPSNHLLLSKQQAEIQVNWDTFDWTFAFTRIYTELSLMWLGGIRKYPEEAAYIYLVLRLTVADTIYIIPFWMRTGNYYKVWYQHVIQKSKLA